jgi:hypothetical protein
MMKFPVQNERYKKHHYIINTILKLHDCMDKNYLKQTLEREEKKPGFKIDLKLTEKN